MTLDEGVERSYSEKPRHAELVIVDSSLPERDRVWSIADGSLASGKLIEHSALPFRLKVQKFYQNSQVFLRAPFVTGGASLANRGIGTGMSLREQPPVATTDGRNTVSAEVELIGENGSLGTWLVSMAVDEPQRFAYSGRSYWIAMRPERVYRPYSMQLIKFTHQRHPGTEVPSQFASRVRLNNPQRNEDREVFISMNQPLRYAGETFYQASHFNGHVHSLLTWLKDHFPEATKRAEIEALFNRLDLFRKGAVLYMTAFLALCVSWLAWPRTLRSTATALLLVAFAGHTIGLLLRMYIQERPPVTSLYASAIFVGWAAVAGGGVIERIQRTGVGAMAAAMIGFLTLVIALNLGADGDTLEVMRAVLDSNFWLATHVVVITIGYSATFVAGALAAIGLIRGVNYAGTVYGVTCFALLFSFVGTILGGIWADQSWGRFWGWDPKENGALLIVLWNAMILHLRWGRFLDDRALMACAVFGNVITSFSWFGVNMLGVGLHSYGFMDGAPFWLGTFVVSQLAIMALAFVPRLKLKTTRIDR